MMSEYMMKVDRVFRLGLILEKWYFIICKFVC